MAGPPITLYGVDAKISLKLIRTKPLPTLKQVAKLRREQILGILVTNGVRDERIRHSKSKWILFYFTGFQWYRILRIFPLLFKKSFIFNDFFLILLNQI